ncbi:hypothetical protein H8L32_01945 [Undibacterium sp. CY18W]|uniref:Preprotein translocase subunit SecG n=1 Tax=Undibacterium hunanense TaxID=2762292 RepID=A0ABR6ZK35_9BURK|nr:hypothetical protein [Undibacterium hunanense]MBC3916237.1 hypothetical protein [Undibacterium hunanense]
MWKILVGFIIFAVVALFIIFKAGDKVDMQGEAAGHNPTEVHSASASASEPTPPPAPVAASTASVPAPASDASASSASK